MSTYVVRLLGVSALLCSLVPDIAVGQGRVHPRWEIPGFDFRRDGVLRTKARNVRALRARLLAQGQYGALNAALVTGAPTVAAVSGPYKVPAILFRYRGSPTPSFQPADYDAVLYAATPPAGRPYTFRSYYAELSNGLLEVQGQTFGYATLDSNEVWYTGGTSTTCASANPYGSSNCNGLFSSTALSQMRGGLREALTKLDATVNFAPYSEGGFIPLVLFIHQAVGGECGPSQAPQNHLWSHRSSLGTFTTNDPDPQNPGQNVRISDYILLGGLGGAASCNSGEIMPIGTVVHESGHGLDLPDLYDTNDQTEGVGQWDVMGSGSFTTGLSPARMSAWSLNELGWITIVPLTTTGTYTFDAAPLSDTAFRVRVQDPNPRGEYYLLENRQRQEADTAMIRVHCQRAGSSPGCPGGLLIWHIDSAKIAQSLFSNSVNTGPIHGVAVVQADSFGNLDASPGGGNSCSLTSMSYGCSNRGDAGDLFPGATNNTRGLVFRTNPAALQNHDGSFAGFAVDSIKQLVPDRQMSFRLRFGGLTIVRASDTTAAIQFEGATYNVFRDLLEEGKSYTVSFTDPQIAPNGRTRFKFLSWSDGGAITHSYTGHLAGETLTANLSRDFKLIATVQGAGTIEADTAGVDLVGGTFIPSGRTVTLTATPDAGVTFGGWCGDTVTTNTVVALPMQKPYTVVADFGALVFSAPPARPNAVMGAAYTDALESSGGGCAKTWAVTGGALPPGLTLRTQDGVITGFPRQTGDFTFTVTVTSGAQSETKTFTISVTAPTLATADVTTQLLGPTAPLNADQVRYLDFLGNNNGSFDIGDFLAWVKQTGAPASAAALLSLPRRTGGQP